MNIKRSLHKIAELAMGLSIITTLALTGCGGDSAAGDTTAPTTTVAPAVSGTTGNATMLSVTINEDGTGYYLAQAAASAVPAVSAVQAGTSFAMTANVAATPAINGLAAGTAYKIYFVAKDAANNVQAAVQNVAVTTASYVSQGGLTWMPITFQDSWANADAYCANFNGLGQTGWRMPTQSELGALFSSGLMNGQGWTLNTTWSSTVDGAFANSHFGVTLSNGNSASSYPDSSPGPYVSCVFSNIPVANAGTAQNVTTGAVVTLNGSASSDPNGDPLTYSWTLTTKPASSTATLTGATSAAPTFTADLAGTYVATLIVNDGTLNSTAATVTITVWPAGYVFQGGLIWMPISSSTYTYAQATTLCAGTINGLTGWRLPTSTELISLYWSGAMNGQGWTIAGTWSSTYYSPGFHNFVALINGGTGVYDDTQSMTATCVR